MQDAELPSSVCQASLDVGLQIMQQSALPKLSYKGCGDRLEVRTVDRIGDPGHEHGQAAISECRDARVNNATGPVPIVVMIYYCLF